MSRERTGVEDEVIRGFFSGSLGLIVSFTNFHFTLQFGTPLIGKFNFTDSTMSPLDMDFQIRDVPNYHGKLELYGLQSI